MQGSRHNIIDKAVCDSYDYKDIYHSKLEAASSIVENDMMS